MTQTQNTATYTLEDFAADVEQVVQEVAGESAVLQNNTEAQSKIVEGSQPLLARFLTQGKIPQEYCGPQEGAAEEESEYSYRVNMLYRGERERFVIISTMWPPNAATGVHDHNGTFVVEGVYQGEMTTTKYKRLDDGSRVGHADLEQEWSGAAGVGETTHVTWPDEDIHEYTNNLPQPSVTIHIYGADPAKETTNYFDLEEKTYAPLTHSFPYDNEK